MKYKRSRNDEMDSLASKLELIFEVDYYENYL